MVVEQKQQNLLSLKNYFDRFYEIKEADKSDRATFELLENEYFNLYSQNRYSSYESFKSSKWRYLNNCVLNKNK